MRDDDLSYFEEEEFKDCLARYEDKKARGESIYLDPTELTDIADYYMSQGRDDEATECIEYALRLHPGSVDPLVFKARQSMFSGNYDEASAIRDEINDQSDREVIFLNGELILRTQNAEAASDYWHKMSENYADEEADYTYEIACILLDYGQYEEAYKWVEEYHVLAPDDEIRYLTLRVDALAGLPDQQEKAIGELDALLDKEPYNIRYWLKMAQLKMLLNDFNGTIDACEYALAVDDENPSAAALKAHAVLAKGEFEDAHRLLTAYHKQFGTSVQTLLDDGIAQNHLGEFKDAVDQLKQALQMAGRYHEELSQIYLHLSFAYSKLNRLSEAVESLEQSHAIDPEAFSLPLLKGHIYLENELLPEAGQLYQEAIAESTDSDVTYLMIAVALCEKRHYDWAYTYLKTLEENGKEEIKGTAYAYMAFCHYWQQNYADFLHYLQLSCEQDPDTTEQLFSEMFPDIEPSEYYRYLIFRINSEGEQH